MLKNCKAKVKNAAPIRGGKKLKKKINPKSYVSPEGLYEFVYNYGHECSEFQRINPLIFYAGRFL